MKTLSEYANMIDHTNLKPFITSTDWKTLCDDATSNNFKTVAINNAGIEVCLEFLKESEVLVDAAVSFPLGQCTLETKVFETQDAINKGAGEVDYVINISALKEKDYDYITEEMRQIVDTCRRAGVISKVIFETCYLEDEEIIRMCEIANQVEPDFIKTSTGFGTHGAKARHVALMRKHAKETISIKASGGVSSGEDFLAMVAAGASRIGTSSGLKIIEELKEAGVK